MTEQQAITIAPVFGGRPWQPYPGIWLLLVDRDDGSVIVIDDDVICTYDDERALEEGSPAQEIRLDTPY